MSETKMQIGVIRAIRELSKTSPQFQGLHSIPNHGKRRGKTGRIQKNAGLLAGVADLFLPLARGGYHGLYIELKTPDGKQSDVQREFESLVIERGYLYQIRDTVGSAVALIIAYAKGNIKLDGAVESR